MNIIDYSKILTGKRCNRSSKTNRSIEEECESNRGRIIQSAAIRRLQKKTQVFPLEENAAVRSRLTHSLEVQQTGRFIAKSIINEFIKNNRLDEYELKGLESSFISLVEMSCLMHDIGNPPFGHLGESAISTWMRNSIDDLIKEQIRTCTPQKSPSEEFIEKIKTDISNFEGNAQAIRLIHSLQALNLTYSQIASLMKYTRPAYSPKGSTIADKKPGYYLSEEPLIRSIEDFFGRGRGKRFPLAYIMEAADDISYCIADLEDAIDKDILKMDTLHAEICNRWKERRKDDDYLINIAEKAMKRRTAEKYNEDHAYIVYFRTSLVNDLVDHAANRFIKHHEAIFSGEFNEPLLNEKDKFGLTSEILKEIARDFVFNNIEVESLELKGYAIISGLLDIFKPILCLPHEKMVELVKTNYLKEDPISTRLFHRLPNKHKNAYKRHYDNIEKDYKLSCPNEKYIFEWYFRARLILDYISGMTDQFAFEEYQKLSAMSR